MSNVAGRQFNESQTRMIDDALFGVACYEGSVSAGEFIGHHQGCAETAEIAERWLRGEDVELLRIYQRPKGSA